ncbi:DUF5132 domain-containing protein [Streptomyces sp. 891-h]|uniref:DUF5132 domain-containing protein n=1 Tax=unclassified Streptomyces TaxID=2593676 RepID=UPI001FA9FE0E|nr:DUF5132 domain-containing protein [Streptomyces sp. 891-h]UNZ20800.1 DUF5132 domain-containing protein [Streptomyces sp. 891-h]
MPPVVPVFAVGVIAAPLVKKMLKPVVRGVVRTSVKIASDAKRAAHEVNEELYDIAAEASAEITGAKEEPAGSQGQLPKKPRPGTAKTKANA